MDSNHDSLRLYCIELERKWINKNGYLEGSRTVCAPKREGGLSLITESAVPGRCKRNK